MTNSADKNKSSSSTSQNSEDNKVTATEGGVAVGKDGSFSYINEIGPEAAAVIEQAFDLAKNAGLIAVELHQQNKDFQDKALEAAAARATAADEISNLKDQVIFKQVLPWLVGGVVVLGMVQTMGKK